MRGFWGVAVAGACWLNASNTPQADAQILAPTLAAPTAPLEFVGAIGCSATACHGGEPRRPVGGEYMLWLSRDPHAKAFEVLTNDLSRRIMTNLSRTESATESQLCLACHAASPHPTHRADGVSCEACHGPAERWLAAHTIRAEELRSFGRGWSQRSPEERSALGHQDTKDLLVRAKLCSRCHVGSPGAEVDHELIAAGHPRLNFELSAFLEDLPRHWDERADRVRIAGAAEAGSDPAAYEWRMWAVGQVVSAAAAMELVESRARDAEQARPAAAWPELAGYDCYSCHRPLSPNLEVTGRKRPLGAMAWGAWHLPMARAVVRQLQPAPSHLDRRLADLVSLMQNPFPDPIQARRLAGDAREEFLRLASELARAPAAAPDVRRMLVHLARDKEFATQNWDSAAQCYLALSALLLAQRDHRTGTGAELSAGELRIMTDLNQMLPTLSLPEGQDGPTSSQLRQIEQAMDRLRLEIAKDAEP